MANVGTVDFTPKYTRQNIFYIPHFPLFAINRLSIFEVFACLHITIQTSFIPFETRMPNALSFSGHSLKIYGLMPTFNIQIPLYTENTEIVLHI